MDYYQFAFLFAQADTGKLFNIIANFIYLVLAAIALWGAFCVIMVWTRVSRQRFKNEAEQAEFLNELEPRLMEKDFDGAAAMCDGDPRAVPQLSLVAIANHHIGYSKVKRIVMDRFQRDVLSELEQRLSWVKTVIASAPMVGLFGTVFGMMGAFSKLATSENVEPAALANDISVALITTASGLAIALPLVLLTNSINIRIRKMEDLVGSGITRIMDTMREALSK
ncbi:MAG: MotA/TolQ/ExbB proton channel family protein [Planctomycetales bacterium]|nr:MotA/TolQ/ExbB proton channel family protein [Planctomycetales bacterium]